MVLRLVFVLYVVGLAGLFFSYALEGARYYWRSKDQESSKPVPLDKGSLPLVTIQLPVCNESSVVERLIDSCCLIDYPKDRLEIQVLDDSTDDTTPLIARKVDEYARRGFDIRHLRRHDRTGHKAGNLQYGLRSATGEFIAVFDADTVPDPDFLLITLPYFQDAAVGIVHTCVRHMNRLHSIVTLAQDPIGSVPSGTSAKSYAGHFINVFPGSSGILRTSCVIAIGGWEGDTLAEDEDLSIRAYLNGWRCVELQDALARDELPERMVDFKARLARCNTGPVECYKKHVTRVLTCDAITTWQKLTMLPTLHCYWLSLSSVGLIALASVPLVLMTEDQPVYRVLCAVPSLCAMTLALAVACHRRRTSIVSTILLYVGTCVHGGWAVLKGLLGVRSSFTRTPKYGSHTTATKRTPDRSAMTPATFLEGGLTLYFLAALVVAFQVGNLWFVPFHLLCVFSCGFVFALSTVELW